MVEYGQTHLFEHWPALGNADVDKQRQVQQLTKLHALYPGGLATYINNARKLLHDSRLGVNPYDGYTPEVPHGLRLATESAEFLDKESIGMQHMHEACFVLVAGGLGERLGYNGIKVELPTEISTGKCFLQLYAENILALQERVRENIKNPEWTLPLAIMTSGDTHERTVKLLAEHHNFGMAHDQITIVKQELVPALKDASGRFAQMDADLYEVQVKPHGHGDVHTLLHQAGLVAKWTDEGRRWVLFFQDTNGLVFHSLPAALGVSVSEQFDVNSLTVPRKPGEAVGAICKLNHKNGSSLTINVEYNQLDPLLRSTISADGDKADHTGFSPFPGNINVLIFNALSYRAALDKSGGAVPEFVNPKYKDAAKTIFTPTRLECMMQDFPKLLEPSAKVGFTQMERWMCFSAVKNNIVDAAKKSKDTGFAESGSSGESDMYYVHRRKLRMIGADIDVDGPAEEFAGIKIHNGAHVVLSPSFATTFVELKQKLSGSKISISSRSTVIVDGRHIEIKHLNVDGALVLQADKGAEVAVESLDVKNDGWSFSPIDPNDKTFPDSLRIRAYQLEKKAAKEFHFVDGSQHVLNEVAHS